MTIKGVENIATGCVELYQWKKEKDNYNFDSSPSLELEHQSNPLVTDEKDILIDYYIPIIEKK